MGWETVDGMSYVVKYWRTMWLKALEVECSEGRCEVKELEAGTAYKFQVVLQSGAKPESPVVELEMDKREQSELSVLVAEAQEKLKNGVKVELVAAGKVHVEWESVDGVSYRVKYKRKDWWSSERVDSDNGSAEIEGLEVGFSHTFTVAAAQALGYWTDEVEFTIPMTEEEKAAAALIEKEAQFQAALMEQEEKAEATLKEEEEKEQAALKEKEEKEQAALKEQEEKEQAALKEQ